MIELTFGVLLIYSAITLGVAILIGKWKGRMLAFFYSVGLFVYAFLWPQRVASRIRKSVDVGTQEPPGGNAQPAAAWGTP